MQARRELIEAVRERYRTAGRTEKKRILDEFCGVGRVSPKARRSGVEGRAQNHGFLAWIRKARLR